MGTASAIPKHLYSYSDECTHTAQGLQDWVRMVLRPALEAYLRGSAQSMDGVNVDTSAVSARAGSIETELPKRIAEAYYTDRDVRRVGLAFEIAGGHGGLARPSGTPVKATDGAIDDSFAQYDAGAAAAAQLKFSPIPADVSSVNPDRWLVPIFAVLERNADNPEFCQGLLEAGGPAAVQNLLIALASGQFHANLMNPATGHVVTGQSAAEILTKIFRNGLANPNIAAQLAPYLATVIPSVLAEVGPHWRQLEAWRQLLPVITTIVSELHDPQVVLHLTKAIGETIPEGFTAEDLRKLMPELTALMSMGVSQGITPWGKGERLQTWAERYGQQTATTIAPYLAAMKAADLSQNERNELLKSMFQGAYLNAAFIPLAVVPGSDFLVFVAAAGALQSWVGSKDPTDSGGLGHILKDTNPNLDILTINNLIDAKAGHFAMISMLLAKGYVRDSNLKGDHPLKSQGGQSDIDQVLKIAAHPDQYYIVGSHGDQQVQLNVGQLIHDFNSGAGYLDPKSKIYQLLTEK